MYIECGVGKAPTVSYTVLWQAKSSGSNSCLYLATQDVLQQLLYPLQWIVQMLNLCNPPPPICQVLELIPLYMVPICTLSPNLLLINVNTILHSPVQSMLPTVDCVLIH